jgi:hypothetical protein
MLPTDAILQAIQGELEFWRPLLDQRSGQLDSLRIVVHLHPRAGVPRRVQVAPETNREVRRADSA